MQTSDTTAFNSNTTSGNNPSIWIKTAFLPGTQTGAIELCPLSEPATTDVLIVGGGIAGLSTAYNLLLTGKKVIVVEDGFPGSGETGRTTAHLTYSLGERYTSLEQLFGEEKTRLIAQSHDAAIDWIRSTIEREQIECDLKTVDGYLFAHETDTEETVLGDCETLQKIGMPVSISNTAPGLRDGLTKRCLNYPGQAQFHPLLYLQGLTNAILRMGGQIYIRSRAEKISSEGATVNGHDVKADHIVIAANTAINNLVQLHTKQWPYRTYAIAVRIPKGSLQPALWWDTGDQDSIWMAPPYHYVRTQPENEEHDLLIVGGEDHRTGQEDKEDKTQEDRYRRLREWAEEHFDNLGETVAHWSGQTLYSIDGISFLGKNPGNENIYVITADCGNGMTSSTIGALLITDLINGRENPWKDVYDPSRAVINRHPGEYLHEVGDMIRQYGDWLTPGDQVTIEALRPGHGAVIRNGLKKIAVYRDENNKLHSWSAVCPHLGGILHWNEDEKSFDCPVHGSRFTGTGTVINGPANSDLSEVDPPKRAEAG
jgi:glycine/D-amino acid oxidase-like deaminating enzyme/nitrite reductase/ring-hydroxylating ferredoxin subunit